VFPAQEARSRVPQVIDQPPEEERSPNAQKVNLCIGAIQQTPERGYRANDNTQKRSKL